MAVLTALDWVILGVVGLSAIMSVFRGFVKEASSIFSWVAAFIIASRFYEKVASLITFSNDPLTRKAIASIVLFIGSLIILGFLSSIISSLVKKAGLSVHGEDSIPCSLTTQPVSWSLTSMNTKPST